MGKHHDKILKALEIRKKNVPTSGKGAGGYHTPGSMNKRKTGYPKRGK